MAKQVISWLVDFKIVLTKSFFPMKRYVGGDEKKAFRKIAELLRLKFRDRSLLPYYYAFGMNLKDSNANDFIGRNEFFKLKNRMERKLMKRAGCQKMNYAVATKDKYYASAIMSANNIPCVENLALLSNSKIIWKDGRMIELEGGFPILPFPIIIKNTILEYNEGFYSCELAEQKYLLNRKPVEFKEILEIFKKGNWVIQEVVKSHREIRAVNDTALNTTRILTLFDGREPVYLAGYQTFATGKEITDSWGKGAVYVGIDLESNCLKKYGYFHPNMGPLSRVEAHPDSHVLFAGHKISELSDAVETCLKAHRLFYFQSVIGWDVALTDHGPLILEANEKPGINAVQCLEGGLRKRIHEFADRIIHN